MLGDQLAIAMETGRRLGMGTNMYPAAALLGQDKDESLAALPVDELIEKADGFAGVFPGMFSLAALPSNDDIPNMENHASVFGTQSLLVSFLLILYANN